jgi:hypothetical protein
MEFAASCQSEKIVFDCANDSYPTMPWVKVKRPFLSQ